MKRTANGFTIVELLIVIVVIAILATISVVAYNGIQQRARASVAQSDLQNLGKAMELFRAEHDRYPATATISTSATDLESMLRQTGLYSPTRANQTDWDNDIPPAKRFLFCTPNGDSSRYAIVADVPVLTATGKTVSYQIGKTTPYIDQTGIVKELTYTDVGALDIQSTLCVIATGVQVVDQQWGVLGWSRWSNAIPLSWAQ